MPPPAGAALRRRARYCYFGARLNQWVGRRSAAARLCRRALAHCDYIKAYQLLAQLEMPAENHLRVLERVHRYRRPVRYLEIGVGGGSSLHLAQPPTLAFGVDPAPNVQYPLGAHRRLFAQTSDDFFAQHDLRAVLGGELDMAFIDGMHHFEYALRDFINIEPLCAPDALVFVHDCFPIDARSAAREQTTAFWSGDVWRLIVLLKKYRPDLAIHTIGTPPTGLGMITRLNPGSTVLRERLADLIAEGMATGFESIAGHRAEALNLLRYDWDRLRTLLDARTSPAVPAKR